MAQLDLLQEMVNFMDRNTNGVQQYYQTIRDRLANYIKSDYLANSETLLLYADDILGEMCPEEINIAKEPYIETSSSYRKVNDGIRDAEIPDNVKEVLLKLVEAKLGIYSTPFEHQVTIFYHDQEALGKQIINLVKVITEDELIRRTGKKNIVFKKTQK